jgi:hypothetical protein
MRMRAALRGLERTIAPLWLSIPLACLGVVFIIAKPLGFDWFMYGSALVIAAAAGLWAARRYEQTVLERSEQGVVVRFRRRTKQPDRRTKQPVS